MENIINQLVEVELKHKDDFLKIKETLTRMGVSSKGEKILYQSCHILHKRGKYYICHFKELFLLDGKTANISEQDVSRRNGIIHALEAWGLLVVVNPNQIATPKMPTRQIKIITHAEKPNWTLVAKYNIGKGKK